MHEDQGKTPAYRTHRRNQSTVSCKSFAGHIEKPPVENISNLQKFVRLCQYGVIGGLERFFVWYGELVSANPRTAILCCFLATFIGGLGLIRFYEEGDAASLVIPRNSKFRNDINWLDDNFPREIRVHSIVYEAENVLTPSVIRTMYRQRKALQQLQLQDKTFQDMCIKVPILKFPVGGFGPDVTIKPFEENWENWEEEEQEQERAVTTASSSSSSGGGLGALLGGIFMQGEIDIDILQKWSNDFYPDPYCAVATATEMACYELNILELWGDQGVYSEVSDQRMETLTREDILDRINNKNVSQIFLKEKDFKSMLGKIQYNKRGEIIGAGAVEMKFYTTVNVSAVKQFGTASRGEKIDTFSYAFEGEMIKLLHNKTGFPDGVQSHVNVQRQFFESFVGQTFKDADKLAMGYALVFIYVNVMLSKLNFVEHRVWLAVVGILSVVMGMILAYGLCSMFGLFYSAAHTVIPFLLLGIGIDNIFVITQAYDTLETSSVPLSLTKRFGQTMGHAGVAVSVTTFTDVMAFFVGSNTILPGLESFCIYAAVAIFAIYLMQVTHFVAWMSLDQRRINDHRDGCCCCIRHKNFRSPGLRKQSMLNKFFFGLGKLVIKLPVKLLVLATTIGLVVGGIWGTLNLDQEYQPEWLLPPESEVAKWFVAKSIYFPSAGEPGYIMIRQINIPKELDRMDELVDTLRSRTKNIDWVNPWHRDFRDYVNQFKATNQTFQELMEDDSYFRNIFTQFLFSPKGAIYQAHFWFAEPLECGQPAPDVLLQAIPFSHVRFDRSSDWIPAMEEVEAIVQQYNFSNYSFPIALTYINWKTDAIVGTELLRNVGIALICIFVTTLATLGSWRGSLLVMMCVLLTCIDVSGFMHWWGLSIDITTMNVIIISVGLCVDFCAHIVHGFLTGNGNREERILFIMEFIAPAVMNGGFSTIVALSLLVTSQSRIFMAFFKIFFMICVFGLFHGLVTLPVVLSFIGPTEESKSKKKPDTEMGEIWRREGDELRQEEEKALRQNRLNKEEEAMEVECCGHGFHMGQHNDPKPRNYCTTATCRPGSQQSSRCGRQQCADVVAPEPGCCADNKGSAVSSNNPGKSKQNGIGSSCGCRSSRAGNLEKKAAGTDAGRAGNEPVASLNNNKVNVGLPKTGPIGNSDCSADQDLISPVKVTVPCCKTDSAPDKVIRPLGLVKDEVTSFPDGSRGKVFSSADSSTDQQTSCSGNSTDNPAEMPEQCGEQQEVACSKAQEAASRKASQASCCQPNHASACCQPNQASACCQPNQASACCPLAVNEGTVLKPLAEASSDLMNSSPRADERCTPVVDHSEDIKDDKSEVVVTNGDSQARNHLPHRAVASS